MNRGKISLQKKSFLNNLDLFLSTREKILNNFKSKIFPIKNLGKNPTTEPTPESMVFDIKLRENFINKIENDEKNRNNEIFRKYFGCMNPSFLANNLYKANQDKSKEIINHVHDGLIGLRNAVNIKTIPENENPDKLIDIVN